MTREKALLATTDAMVWAKEFCRTFSGQKVVAEDEELPPNSHTKALDPGAVVGWFANAIETAKDEGYWRGYHEGEAENDQ